MVAIAIGILWLCIGIIVLGGAIYLLLKIIKLWVPDMDSRFETGVWLIFGILICIYVLTALVGGGGLPHPNVFH